MVEQELQQILQAIPDIRWLRIISVEGICHPLYGFDAGNIKQGNTEREQEEDVFSAVTAAGFSLSGRISIELGMGESRFGIVIGQNAVFVTMPIGDGTEWVMSFSVRGLPSLDAIITHFKDRDYLASLVPLL